MRLDTDDSRRQFLQHIGLGVAGIWGTTSGISFVENAQDTTCTIPTHGNAVPFRRDCRPIRPRQVANSLTAAEITQLKAAYQAMRALDTSDPNDPRGFKQQANVHCYHCATNDPVRQMHFTWRFFAWHRAYLYFHERILGKLIGDANFRLPYWGWDSPGFHALPNPYVTPNDVSNPLFNGTRGLAPGALLPDEDVGATVISDVLSLANFAEFGGSAGSSGGPESSPHGSVHIDVDGDMRYFETAAQDPVFYQHHATVDKLWSDWNKSAATHLNPTDPAFTDLTFTFFDENKVWRSIKASQVLDHERSLRYVYEPYRFWTQFICLIWHRFDIGWRTTHVISIPKANRALTAALASDTPLRIELIGLQLPEDRSTVYRIYSSQAEAEADRGPDSPGYLGNVAVVLPDRTQQHRHIGRRNAIISVGPQLRRTLAGGGRLQPFLVDRDVRAAAKKAIALRANDVRLSVGEMDKER